MQLQTAVGQTGVDGPEVQPCNQHSKHAQEKAVPRFGTKSFAKELVAENKNLVADNKKLHHEVHKLSQSLHEQQAENADMHGELQCMQNNLTMQGAALASKDKQLLQVLVGQQQLWFSVCHLFTNHFILAQLPSVSLMLVILQSPAPDSLHMNYATLT